MPAPKFKESLKTNVSETVTMAKRGQQYPNKFKPGEMQYHYFFKKSDNVEYSHYANSREEEILSCCQPGDQLEVVLAEGQSKDGPRYTYIVWDIPGGSLASAAKKAPLVGVQAGMKQEESKQDYMDEQKIKGVEIGVRGIYQALIASKTHPDTFYDDLIDVAIDLDKKLRTKVSIYASEL